MESIAVASDLGAVFLAALIVGLPWLPALSTAGITTIALERVGLNRGRLNLRISDDVTAIFSRVVIAMVLSALFLDVGDASQVAFAAMIAAGLLFVTRATVYQGVATARRHGHGVQDVVIVGSGPVGHALAQVLTARPEFGMRVIGFADRRVGSCALPVLGEPQDLPEVIARTGVRRVILAFGHAREAEMVSVLRSCASLPVELYTLPRFFELGMEARSRAAEDLWGFPVVKLRGGTRARSAWWSKRIFDVVLASLLLVATAPLFALCAIAVKISSPGPVLFRQKRVGQFGQPIEMLKFRTMTENDDSDTKWTVDDDQRVTVVGRALRPSHLDELPQLWNVLRGEMSIVGPRPERPFFADQFRTEIRGYDDRHRYPVGLTGWAQVNGLWGDTSIEDRARLDNRYIENWSLWQDIIILWRTVPTLFGRRDE